MKSRNLMINGSILIAMSAMSLSIAGCNSSDQTAVESNTAQTEGTHISDASVINQNNETNPNLLQGLSATVYKDANCGCCTEWISYANKEGLQSEFQHPKNLSMIKDKYNVPQEMRSCHTTVTSEGYVFEGHIPAKFISQFMANPPNNAIGLAVPNMPLGSPGMDYDNQFTPYKVFQINKDGSYEVFASVNSPKQHG